MKLHPTDKDFIEYVKEEYDPLPDTVKNYLSNVALKYMSGILIELESCDSPIEYLLGIALHKLFPNTIGIMTNDFFINAQESIDCGENKYRVDFLIVIKYKEVNYGFVVECDGHEFHEKTKEQAKKDKKRDRNLMVKGIPVIRFTGSEIVANPDKCAREVLEIIYTYLKR